MPPAIADARWGRRLLVGECSDFEAARGVRAWVRGRGGRQRQLEGLESGDPREDVVGALHVLEHDIQVHSVPAQAGPEQDLTSRHHATVDKRKLAFHKRIAGLP